MPGAWSSATSSRRWRRRSPDHAQPPAHRSDGVRECPAPHWPEPKVATLVTAGCPVGSGTLTAVSVEDQPDGRPLISLERSSPKVRELVARPVATLSVAGPTPFPRLDLTGPLKPCRAGRPGHRSCRLSPLSGRLVGTTSLPLAPGDSYAARPAGRTRGCVAEPPGRGARDGATRLCPGPGPHVRRGRRPDQLTAAGSSWPPSVP